MKRDQFLDKDTYPIRQKCFNTMHGNACIHVIIIACTMLIRDHVEWDEDQLRQAEEMVSANSTEKVAPEERGIYTGCTREPPYYCLSRRIVLPSKHKVGRLLRAASEQVLQRQALALHRIPRVAGLP